MRPARGVTLAAALVGAAFLVLLTWAAAVGPDQLVHRRPAGSTTPRTQVEPTPTATPSGAPTPDPLRDALDRPTSAGWLGWVVAVTGLLGLGYIALRLLRRLWRAWREREITDADPGEVEFEVLSPPALAREVTADAAEQERLLAAGTPRNGIVRCWDRFEQVAAGNGMARAHWETPAEFTLRLFDVLEADARPVQALATLYREARFSDHELTEADRATAAAALAAIHRSLGARTR